MGFKKEPKALEIFEKPEVLLTGGFIVNHITHSKWFSQTGNEKSLNLLKDQFYLSPEREGDRGFFGGVESNGFQGGMKGGREDQSSPTEYKGDHSLYLSPGRGGTEVFGGHMVSRGIEGWTSRHQ